MTARRLAGLLSAVCALGLVRCGTRNAASPAQVGSAQSATEQQVTASAAEQATQKFLEFSRELDKLGSDERVDARHLEDELRAIVAIDAHNTPARFDLIILQGRGGDEARADQGIADIGRDDPSFAPAQENVAATWVRDGQIDRAVATYRQIISKFPKNQTSRLALARIMAEQKKYTEAIDLCREVLQRQADAMEAFRILAESYNAVGNTPMAELIIGRGLKASRDDVPLHELMARILLERDDLAGGVAKLKQVVTMDPKRLDIRAKLADIALSYRDFGNAAQQYEAILKERPSALAAQVNLAVSYKGLGRYEQAEKIYKEVLTKDATNLAALWNSGVLYHRHLNRYDEATASFKRYKEMAPTQDEKVAEVDALLAEIDKLKTNQEAQQAREEHERKKKEAVDAVCAAVAAGKPANAAAVGSEQERIEVAWQLMVSAQQSIQAGTVEAGEAAVKCAFALVPATPAANTQACAPMHVMWTQILYQLNRVPDAAATIAEALKCDPNNPDAQLIEQQLKEIASQPAEPAK